MQTSQSQYQGSQMGQSNQNNQPVDQAPQPTSRRWAPEKWSKFVSSGAGGLVIAAAIVNFITLTLDVRIVILSIHYIILGLVIILSDFGLQYVQRNFRLLKFMTGKGLYLIFLGTIMFDSRISFQLLASIVVMMTGFSFVVGALTTDEAR